MNIGIIGAGPMSSTLAGQLTKLGHTIYLANSRGPETLKDVAASTGAIAVTARQAARNGELIIVAIPLKHILDLPNDLFAGVPADVPVIDTSNYYPLMRDAELLGLEGDLLESQWVQQQVGRPVVKVFNNIYAAHLQSKAKPAHTPSRVALPVASDNVAHKQQVLKLVDELGFDAVDSGSLGESWRQQPGTPLYGTDLSAADLQEQLARLGTVRTAAQRAQYVANHAFQEREMMK